MAALGVSYAAAATAGTVAESKKSNADMMPVADDVKHLNAKENHVNDVTEKINTNDLKMNADDPVKKDEISADGKAVKQDKSTVGASKPGKTGDREVFVPAPPPTTNAWAKRLQNQGPATSAAPIQPVAAPQPSNTNTARENKQQEKAATKVEPNKPAVSNSLVADADLHQNKPAVVSKSALPGEIASKTTEDESAALKLKSSSKPNSAVGDSTQQKSEAAENIPELKSKRDSGEATASGAEVKVPHEDTHHQATGGKNLAEASTTLKNNDTVANAVEKVVKSSPEEIQVSEKQLSPLGDNGSAKVEDKRRWEKNAAHPKVRTANHHAKTAGLNDSGDWPSLQKNDQSPKSQPIKLPASPGDTSEQSALSSPSESGDKTAVPPETGADCDQSSLDQTHTKPLSDSGIEDGQSKSKKKGNKQKWLPYEIDLPKTRRRRGSGRTRTDSRGEQQETSTRPVGDRESTRDNARRPRGGRDNHDRSSVGMRRNRPYADKTDTKNEEAETGSSKAAMTGAGDGPQPRNDRSAAPVGSGAPPGRMGYQVSRRAAHRGRGVVYGYTAGRGRFPQFWGGPTAQYPFMDIGLFETPYQYYSVEQPPTYFAPIVSQSDYYTSILADDSAKKLIAQQIEYYFSTENLVKDFYLRRQMDNEGWIPVQLLANFRRVRIHTGTVNVELIVESMMNSKIVEISSDRTRMRARDEPSKWSIKGMEATNFSSLSVDVPEFVPGKPFKLPTSPATVEQTSDAGEVTDKVWPVDGSAVTSDTQSSVLHARTNAHDDKSGSENAPDQTVIVPSDAKSVSPASQVAADTGNPTTTDEQQASIDDQSQAVVDSQ